MIYINVGEMCFIPMNVHNELFNNNNNNIEALYLVMCDQTQTRYTQRTLVCLVDNLYSHSIYMCLSASYITALVSLITEVLRAAGRYDII